MPEFILDHGTPETARQFQALDSFTQGYIEAMFFTDTGNQENEGLEHATVADLAPEALAKIIADCDAFQEAQGLILDRAYESGSAGYQETYDPAMAGRDYWYTRNGHGTGFWDRGLGQVGDDLATAARYSEVSLYRGDDGLIYLS